MVHTHRLLGRLKRMRQKGTCRRMFGTTGVKKCCKDVSACFQKVSSDLEELNTFIADSNDVLINRSCGKINKSVDCMENTLKECDKVPRMAVKIRFAGQVRTISSIVSEHCEETERSTGSTSTSTDYTTSLDWQSSPTKTHHTPNTSPGVGHNSESQTGGGNLTYAVVGACVGAVIVIAIVIAVLIFLRLKRRSKAANESGVADAVEDEETYTEINESFMISTYNNHYPEQNTNPCTTRSFTNPTPYQDVETILEHHDNYGETCYDHVIQDANGESLPPASYETLNKEPQERSIKPRAHRETGVVGETEYTTSSEPNRHTELENEKRPIANVNTLDKDMHGYLIPQKSHTYVVLEKQSDS